MKRIIKKAAVLGSGVMGSRIALHLAGAGLPVLLLDIVPAGAEAQDDKAARNKLVNDALAAALKSNPSPAYTPDVAGRVTTGNFDDDLHRIADCDWVIEVVVERLDIKQALYEKVESHRRQGTLITTNTSGIPIGMLSKGRSEDFRRHFCGTHFFNPPRYLQLLEIIPGPDTDPEVVQFLTHYGDLHLGKTTVPAKDTPAFIANRIGVFGLMSIFHSLDTLDLNIDEVDALTGPLIGRPKSATFRTADVVGIDTLVKVAQGVGASCPNDEARDAFRLPAWLEAMVAKGWLGDKSGQGFYKKLKGGGGEKEILTLDLQTMDYVPRTKPRFASVDAARTLEDLPQRIKALVSGNDKAAEFLRRFHYALFSYISHRIPEITEEPFRVDDAMKAGFGWEIGAFETWDALGVQRTLEKMKGEGYTVAPWVEEMLASGNTSFFKNEGGQLLAWSPARKGYFHPQGPEAARSFLLLSRQGDKRVWNNAACSVYDIGDSVLGLQWNTKMNSIGGDVLAGMTKAIELAEKDFRGLVMANEGPNFSAGANVGMIFMLAVEEEWDELDFAIRAFQGAMMRARYSSVPVVVAPHGLALGGACELSLHADKCCPAAETYTGLVEMGVGLIPGGGGTKEFVLRASDEMHEDEPETITLKNRFLNIATAKVATSAHEGFRLGIYRKGLDEIVMNAARRVAEAKRSVTELSESGYVAPVQRKDIRVLGRTALGALYAGVHGMWRASYATDHDVKVAKKLAYVMCGGDLSEPALVSEQYLLDLEREAFLSLCGERKTLERIQSVLKGGKPVRN